MKLFVPKNIFSSIFISTIPKDAGIQIVEKESALLVKQMELDTASIALIPSLELINNRTLFVSGELGLAFDGALSNSYFYFPQNERVIKEISVRGDVSINEFILSKIIFEERYASQIQFTLDSNAKPAEGKDYIVTGEENFKEWNFINGLSFSDQVAELIDLPYVNFVFASKDKGALKNFNSLFPNIDKIIEEKLSDKLNKVDYKEKVESYFQENINSLYYEMTGNEIDALNELIKLVYYHGIVDDMFDLKIVGSGL